MLQGIGITPVHMFFSSNADLKWYLMLCLYLPSVTESTCLLDLSPDGESAASHSSRRWCSSSLCGLSSGPSVPCWPWDWVAWSFVHPLCTLDTHRERDPPQPLSPGPAPPYLTQRAHPAFGGKGPFFRVLLLAVSLKPGASQTSLRH